MARVKCPHCFHVNPDQQESCEKCGARLPRISIEAPSAAAEPEVRSGKSQLQFRRGQVVAGRYTVLNLIGQGGMGCIYKVHDNTLGEDVALKTLLPQFLQDKVVLERFYNEAKIARRLAHPNIVRVHDIGEDGKILYISMEYLQGMSLREILDNLRPGERLPIAQTLRIFDQLCSALEYAHQFTVHRDIKPENVMLGQDGAVRLMDFGISKLMANTRLTNASIVMGTPFYMSPEQIRNSRDVDSRADIYSVGVMLYEILTGSVPTGVPKPASQVTKDVPPVLDKIVAKCVEPDPRDRYQSASELRQAFAPVMRHVQSSVSTSRTSITRRFSGAGYDPRKIAGALIVAAIMLAGLWGLGQAEQHRRGVVAAANEDPGTASPPRAAGPAMEQFEAVIERLIPVAESRTTDGLNGALRHGETFWAAAQSESGATAIASARKALQCYLAPLLLKDGMVFVPPGQAVVAGSAVEVPGFLIDAREVTVNDYTSFIQAEPDWKLPAVFENQTDLGDFPVVSVSCIDAMAYAAWRGAALPTEAQWSRAAAGDDAASPYPWDGEPDGESCNALIDATRQPWPAAVGSFEKDRSEFGCYDMIGNVSEWTRSTESPAGDRARPTYQTMMITKGGNYNEVPRSWADRRTLAFEAYDLTLGFRCVIDLPDDPAAAQAVLDGRW